MASDAFVAARLRLASGIRIRRRALGLSRNVLAMRLKVHPTYIAMIERGQRTPDFEMLLSLAKLLRSSLAELDQVSPEVVELARSSRPSTPELQLAEFAWALGLSHRQVDRLIAVGRVMFQLPADKE